MKKKGVWIAGVIIILILIYIFVSMSNNSEKIRIGVFIPLSGSAAYYGEVSQKGVEIAKEEIKEKYPDFDFEVVYGDSEYLPAKGVAEYRNLNSINKLDAVITGASHISLAIKPLAEEDGILQIATFSAADSFSSPNDLSFRVNPLSEIDAINIAKFIKQKEYKRLAIINLQNDFGVSYKNTLKKQLGIQDTGTEVVFEDSFNLGDNDYRSLLLKAKESNPDVVFMAGLASHYGLLMKQSKELDFNPNFLAMWSAEDPAIITTGGSSTEGLVYIYPFDSSSERNQAKNFVSAFESKYGIKPEAYAAQGYEAMRLTSLAFIECERDYDCIQNYLINLKNYDSVFGDLSFDENGDVIYELLPKTIKNGEFVVYE